MKPGRAYAAGALAIAAGALAAAALLPGAAAGIHRALLLTLLVQAPLGWWVVRSLGGPAFLPAFAVGLLARFGLVGVVGLGLVPALGWAPEPVLVALVALLAAWLGLEALVVVLIAPRVSRAGARIGTQAEDS